MRVVAAVPLYPPSSRVGSWLTTHELLAHLVRRGHHVDVVRRMGGVQAPYDLDGVTVFAGNHNLSLIREADLVITHLGDTGAASALAKEAGVPNVRMAHGPIRDDLNGADLIVWNSESFRKRIGWQGRSIVIHPPVRPDDYRTTPGDMVTLVNLSEAKGVRTMWRAAERLPATRFLGVRGGYGHQVIPRAPNVEVIPTVTDMRAIYARTRVLLMPSEHETWGRVAVEAIASGIPVIAHPTDGLRESLGAAGIFIDRNDTNGWARMIRRLTTQPAAWQIASKLARRRSAELDPTPGLERFAGTIEALAGVAA